MAAWPRFLGSAHFRFSQWLPVRQGRDRLSRATFGPSSVARFFPTPRAAGLSATQGGSPRSSGLVTRRSVKFPDGHPGREARKPPGALSVFLQRGIFLCQGPWIGPMSPGLTPPPSVPGALTRGIEAVRREARPRTVEQSPHGGMPTPSALPLGPQKFNFTAEIKLNHGFLKKLHKPVQTLGNAAPKEDFLVPAGHVRPPRRLSPPPESHPLSWLVPRPRAVLSAGWGQSRDTCAPHTAAGGCPNQPTADASPALHKQLQEATGTGNRVA